MDKKTVAYYRVSSYTQTIDMQVHAVTKMAESRGDTIDAVYSETKSARTVNRPELKRMREDARKGEIKKIYVYRLDRLTRSGIRDTLELIQDLKRYGVELVSVSENFELNGPASEMILAAMSWASQMERIALNDRIMAARERMEANGGKWGRPSRASDDKISVMWRLKDEGKSNVAVGKELGVPESTIRLWLKTFKKEEQNEIDTNVP